jgi:hypothetical protein
LGDSAGGHGSSAGACGFSASGFGAAAGSRLGVGAPSSGRRLHLLSSPGCSPSVASSDGATGRALGSSSSTGACSPSSEGASSTVGAGVRAKSRRDVVRCGVKAGVSSVSSVEVCSSAWFGSKTTRRTVGAEPVSPVDGVTDGARVGVGAPEGGRIAGSVAIGVDGVCTIGVLGVTTVCCSSAWSGVEPSGAAPCSMRLAPCVPPAVPPGVAGPTPTGVIGTVGAAGAPRTIGVCDVVERSAPVFSARSTGARASAPLFGGEDNPGHPLTATRVLVKKSTHAAAATKDRVAPRVASRPLGVRT